MSGVVNPQQTKPNVSKQAQDLAKNRTNPNSITQFQALLNTLPLDQREAVQYSLQQVMDAANLYPANTRPFKGIWTQNDEAAFKSLYALGASIPALSTVDKDKNPGAYIKGITDVLVQDPQVGVTLINQAKRIASANKPTVTDTAKQAPFTGSTKQIATSANELSLTDAQKILSSVYKSIAGRDPNAAEIIENQTAYNDALKKSPNSTTTTYNYVNGKLTATNSISSGGIDPTIFFTNRIRQNINNIIKAPSASLLGGPAGEQANALMKMAGQYGVDISDDTAQSFAKNIVIGKMNMNDVEDYIINLAKQSFPHFSEQINKGLNIQDLADPYIQKMSKILEIPSTQINLNDPTIKSALSYTDSKGNIAAKSMYQFEQDLRNDPRWRYTQDAQDTLNNVGLSVLKDFGLAS